MNYLFHVHPSPSLYLTVIFSAMGWARQWLRSLWVGNKESNETKDCSSYGDGEERVEKKRWSFRKSRNAGDVVLGQNASAAVGIEAVWFKCYAETEKEQSKHAIAVAAATAAAADAAVAAARVAVEAVRLTCQGRGTAFSCARARSAAIKIQTAFRRYLARKALRALKALVKLQALVRGHHVRKQAAATLHSMQALLRAQATLRAQTPRILLSNDHIFHPEIRRRRSLERFRLSTSLDSATTLNRSPKIIEIDMCRPKSRSCCRTSPLFSDPATDLPLHAFPSPTPSPIPARISIPSRRNSQENNWCVNGDKYWLSATAHSTPRYMNYACGGNEAVTPAKSVCGAEGVFRQYLSVSNSPKYMENTLSSKAKVWSQNSTKQLPDPRKRHPLSELNVQAKVNVGMQKPCPQVKEAFNFKKAVLGRLDRSSEMGRRGAERQRMW